MNSKAIQLAISTLILLVVGIFVLIAIIVALTGGLDRFKGTTDPYLDTTEAIAVRQACELACEGRASFAFCCEERALKEEALTCRDTRLQISCSNIDCSAVECLQN